MSKYYFTKENLDHTLYELAKTFRKMNGSKTQAEITLVGGAAIVANYHFRDSTTDVDATYVASSAMSESINKVGDDNGFPRGWLNEDFKNTRSYSSKIPIYSKHYKTFCHILEVRVLPADFLIAMKLVALREYKHDRSDIVGLINESKVTKDQVVDAFIKLYGKWEYLENPNLVSDFLDDVYNAPDIGKLYQDTQNYESEGYRLLKQIDENYDVLNKDNVNDVIAQARAAQKKKQELFSSTAENQIRQSTIKKLEEKKNEIKSPKNGPQKPRQR